VDLFDCRCWLATSLARWLASSLSRMIGKIPASAGQSFLFEAGGGRAHFQGSLPAGSV
jgi:hypothetical protein